MNEQIDTTLAQHMADDLNALARRQPDDIFGNVYAYMKSCDESLGTYGIETITDDSGLHARITYCNTGDPYQPTLLFDHEERKFLVAGWGGIAEARNY